MSLQLYPFQQYNTVQWCERFWNKVDFGEHPLDCWIWTAAKNSNGYGIFRLNNKTINAYSIAYKLLIGQVPDGKELHHECQVRSCVNTFWHIFPKTHEENMILSRTTMYRKPNSTCQFKSKCKNGHSLISDDNVYVDTRGQISCRTCRKDAVTRYRNKRKVVMQ